MKLGMCEGRIVGYSEAAEGWLPVGKSDQSLLELLADPGALAAVRLELTTPQSATQSTGPTGLPFKPESLRAFALWESHMVNGARSMVRRFAPMPLRILIGCYESITKSTFPALKPKPNYYQYPQYYMSNHRSVVPDSAPVDWPSFSEVIDFELEIGVVLAHKVHNCSPEDGAAAIGGFVVMNDWSARDTQWCDTRKGTFGGVVKAKTFAGAMSSVLVTADEILPKWKLLRGRVLVNGKVWCEGSTQNPLFDLGEMVAYASMGETLYPGDVLSTGTLPGCCGLELGRFPQPGDTVQLEIDDLGVLTNTIGAKK